MKGDKSTEPSGMTGDRDRTGLPAAVIFDMDGTLVETTEDDFLAWNKLFLEYGRDLTFADYFPLLGKKSVDVVLHVLGLEGEEAQVAMHRKMEYFEEIVRKNGIVTLPFVEAFLQEIQGLRIPIALATSSRTMKMKLVMKESGLAKYFSVFVTGEEVERGKPNPDIFLLAAERLNVPPDHCLVLEDAVNGVAAAKAAGMKCVAITSTHQNADLVNADLVINDFSALNYEVIANCFH
jgi:beta-phosphoglucomutase family hydrolase